jgi:hypothetical protein
MTGSPSSVEQQRGHRMIRHPQADRAAPLVLERRGVSRDALSMKV